MEETGVIPHRTEHLDTHRDLDLIPGWFFASDRALFRWFLSRQRERGLSGDLVELGAYLGKSAVVMGDHLAPGETFTVVDLFEAEAQDDANATEMAASYSTLTRAGFEANYRKFHESLPVVHTAPSSEVLQHVTPGACRFVHVDASHLYEHVALDVDAARTLLGEEGVVVFDDYRSVHTPGVAAAVWEAVLNKGLNPICVSESKLYGTWSDADPVRDELYRWLSENDLAWAEFQEVAGHRLIRCNIKAAPTAAGPGAATRPTKKQARKGTPPKPSSPPPTGLRRFAADWVPPRMLAGAKKVRSKRARPGR